jgi:hypothetical protein
MCITATRKGFCIRIIVNPSCGTQTLVTKRDKVTNSARNARKEWLKLIIDSWRLFESMLLFLSELRGRVEAMVR